MFAKSEEDRARRYCNDMGLDPDEIVKHSPDPSPDGTILDICLTTPRWMLAAKKLAKQEKKSRALTQPVTTDTLELELGKGDIGVGALTTIDGRVGVGFCSQSRPGRCGDKVPDPQEKPFFRLVTDNPRSLLVVIEALEQAYEILTDKMHQEHLQIEEGHEDSISD